jgi:integrase
MTQLTISPIGELAQHQRLADNAAAVYLSRLSSQRSQQTMRGALNAVADLLVPTLDKRDDSRFLDVPFAAMRYQHTAALRAQITARYSPARANTLLAALRGVLKEAWRLGQMGAEDYQRAVDIANVKAETLPRGRDLHEGEVMALARACMNDETPAGIRDAAIIGILATGGLRREELTALTLAHVDSSGRIEVRGGKGRKDRTVYLAGGALAALLDWLDLRGDVPGPLFHPIRKNGAIQHGQPMTAQAVYKLLVKRAAQAGVADFSPHDFRRTFVGDLLDKGVDISIVSKLAGHSDPKTTARYDRRPEGVKREASARLHYPYKRRKLV